LLLSTSLLASCRRTLAAGRRLITCYPFSSSLVHNAGVVISLPYDPMYARSETRRGPDRVPFRSHPVAAPRPG